jgi:hypothetical protein
VTAFLGVFFLALVEWSFYRGFRRKSVVSCWFFVVKLWWIAGAGVVFRRLFLRAKKMSLFENISVEIQKGCALSEMASKKGKSNCEHVDSFGSSAAFSVDESPMSPNARDMGHPGCCD